MPALRSLQWSPAAAFVRRRRVRRWSSCERSLARKLAISAAALLAPLQPAYAQVAGELSIASDYRFRGYSISNDEPVVSASVGYDDQSGAYFGGSATGVWKDGPELLAMHGSAGFAARISSSVSADGGVVHTHYSSYGRLGNSIDYTELYVGLSGRNLSSYLFYSPDYFETGSATLYGQVEGRLELVPEVSVNAHFGHLAYFDQPRFGSVPDRQDWSLAAARQFGRSSAYLSVSGRIVRGNHRDTSLTFGLSHAF